MSNPAVGPLYKRIIDQVIEQSRTDFEENGVDNQMIQTLQDKWQAFLTKKRPAQFPWDPAPQQSEQVVGPSPSAKTQPVTVPVTNATTTSTSPAPPATHTQQQAPVAVKQESGNGYDIAYPSYPSAGSGYSNQPDMAQQRAQHLVQARYANQAQGMNLGPIQLPGQQAVPQRPGYSYPQSNGQQPRPGPPPSNQPNVKQEHSQNQTDGAGDDLDAEAQWSTIMSHRRAIENDEGPRGRRAIDRMLRKQIANNLRSMEAGGLLMPLSERFSQSGLAERAPRIVAAMETAAPTTSFPVIPPPASFDGADDDALKDEDDADAINSDLDDPEDETVDAMVGEDYVGDMIICLYDKVQRVKNKWKCTLKDGVVSVDGKDYVFHKANGEFEW